MAPETYFVSISPLFFDPFKPTNAKIIGIFVCGADPGGWCQGVGVKGVQGDGV